MLKSIFTWWNGATIGIRFTAWRRGRFIGEDDFGNRYYEAKDNRDSYDARKRRWVIYNGYAEASKVPPDWHGWLHYTFDDPPTVAPLKRRALGEGAHPQPDRHAGRPGGRRARSRVPASGRTPPATIRPGARSRPWRGCASPSRSLRP